MCSAEDHLHLLTSARNQSKEANQGIQFSPLSDPLWLTDLA